MNGFSIPNANKEIMSLELQTDYLCPQVDGISTIPTPPNPYAWICHVIPGRSHKLHLATSANHTFTYLPLEGSPCLRHSGNRSDSPNLSAPPSPTKDNQTA